MIASLEMQLSGEPFAQLLGRDLNGFDRYSRLPDQYIPPGAKTQVKDLLGYATAVESYEYSKQPMNNLSFESGAGVSLMFGPLVNPAQRTGDAAFTLLADRLQHLAAAAGASGPAGTAYVVAPPPSRNPFNYYGWPGFWPVMAEYRNFDPTIAPVLGSARDCTLRAGYAAAPVGAQIVGDYECGYNALNLQHRAAQLSFDLAPDALGYAAWKQALWVINYWSSAHDKSNNLITQVADADLSRVGVPGNQVVGRYANASGELVPGVPGTYIGDNPLEGWQGLVMLEEMDNKAELILSRLTTQDGAALGGFASIKEALDYDWESKPRWFPAFVRVTESPSAPSPELATKFFQRPSAFTIAASPSRLRDLAGILGGFATFYAMTDPRNVEVGGLLSSRTTFDGDPFPRDNGLPDGERTPHDRALALVKVALVNMDRLHYDPAHKVLLDAAGPTGRGKHVGTVELAYAIVALRTTYRALTSSLTLYSNDTPDTLGVRTILDQTRLRSAPGTVDQLILRLIRAEADFLADQLTDQTGAVRNGFDFTKGEPDGTPTLIESQSAAIRGLLEAYLATSDTRYRARAVAAYSNLEKRFWREDVRAFRTVALGTPRIAWTPLAFGALQGALRQYWKLEARKDERTARTLLDRFTRTFKLVVNGWDDANGDGKVDFPEECTGAGLQMGERALTGEMPRYQSLGDRDRDCVPDIAKVKLPAALAAGLVLERHR